MRSWSSTLISYTNSTETLMTQVCGWVAPATASNVFGGASRSMVGHVAHAGSVWVIFVLIFVLVLLISLFK